MPFKSKAQQGYLFQHHPEVAKQFAAETPASSYSHLPQHIGQSPPGDTKKPTDWKAHLQSLTSQVQPSAPVKKKPATHKKKMTSKHPAKKTTKGY